MSYCQISDLEASQVALVIKNLPANARDARDAGSSPGSGRSPGGGHGNHSSILTGESPWTEEPGGLQSIGVQRVGHDWSSLTCMHTPNLDSLVNNGVHSLREEY